MAHEARLVEIDASHLTRAEWARILWGVLLRGSRYTLPPLLVVIVTLAVFGVAVGMIALKVGSRHRLSSSTTSFSRSSATC
jgi:hypothetical protein